MRTAAPVSAPKLTAVERVTGLPYAEFKTNYLIPRIPVIFTDATRDWKALANWTPEFFREHFAATEVVIDGKERYKIGDVMTRLLNAPRDQSVPYLRNIDLVTVFPELVGDIQPPFVYSSINWLRRRFLTRWLQAKMTQFSVIELFIGGRGSKFPFLHYDIHHSHAFLSQIYGTKEYILYAPDQTPFLYANGTIASAVNDIENPDWERFPLFRQAVAIRLVLAPGETLFVPSGWWHTARMQGPSITTAVNTVDASNWTDFRRDLATWVPRVMRPLFTLYMVLYGLW